MKLTPLGVDGNEGQSQGSSLHRSTSGSKSIAWYRVADLHVRHCTETKTREVPLLLCMVIVGIEERKCGLGSQSDADHLCAQLTWSLTVGMSCVKLSKILIASSNAVICALHDGCEDSIGNNA